MFRIVPTSAVAIAGLIFACSGALHADPAQPSGDRRQAPATPSVSTYASGLTNPRGLTFGPDGSLYVAEAGTGGSQEASDSDTCPRDFNVFSPYSGGYTGRVVRIRRDGRQETVADNLPSTSDNTSTGFGPTDLAFVGNTLYVLIEMGGCPHGMPDDLPGILRVNPDGTTTPVANLNAWLAVNPPKFIKTPVPPEVTDQEPGGVFHSMIAVGRHLYVVETNRGTLLRVEPRTGEIVRLYDMSIDNREHNPIVMTRRGNEFFVGTFGEDDGPAELAVFDRDFSGYTLPFRSRNPLVGLTWRRGDLYGVEIFPYDDPWSVGTANLVRFDSRTGARTEVLTGFGTFPNGLVTGPDGALYTSNQGVSFVPGDGEVLRIVP
jgi:hypothetical protein